MNRKHSFILQCRRIKSVFVKMRWFSTSFTKCWNIEMKNINELKSSVMYWLQSVSKAHFLNEMIVVKILTTTSMKIKCWNIHVKTSMMFHFSSFLFVLILFLFLSLFLLLLTLNLFLFDFLLKSLLFWLSSLSFRRLFFFLQLFQSFFSRVQLEVQNAF